MDPFHVDSLWNPTIEIFGSEKGGSYMRIFWFSVPSGGKFYEKGWFWMKLWDYDLHLNAEIRGHLSIQQQILKDLGNMDFSP